MKNFYINLNQIKSNPDGQPTVNRQSRLMSYRGNLKNLAMIFAVLVMSVANVGTAWGGVTVFTSVSQETTDGSWTLYGSSAAASSQSSVVFPDPAAETGFPIGSQGKTDYYNKLAKSGDLGAKLTNTKCNTIAGLSEGDQITVYWFVSSNADESTLHLSYATDASHGALIESKTTSSVTGKQLYATTFTALSSSNISNITSYYVGSAGLAYISSTGLYIYAIKITAAASSCTTNPTVEAGSNSSVTATTATVTCSEGISSLGSAGCSISSYGFVIGTSANPAVGGSGVTKHEVGTSYTTTGTSFYKDLTGLTPGTTYYVRPYATNGNGTAYGTQTSFTTDAAAPAAITRRMFLNLGGLWGTDASYKIHAWGDGSSVDYPMTRIGETGIYYADIPISKNMIQYVRNNYDNQSYDLNWHEAGENQCAKITAWHGGDGNAANPSSTSWEIYHDGRQTFALGNYVYYDNSVTQWSNVYFRIGKWNVSQAYKMTKEPGTKDLYSYQRTGTAWEGYEVFNFADNWANQNGNVYYPDNDKDTWSGNETNFARESLSSNRYYRGESPYVTSSYAKYHTLTELSAYTVTTASASHCTVTLQKCTNYESDTYTSLTSGGTVLPTQYIKVTVTPDEHYEFGSVVVTGVGTVTANTAGTPGVYYVTGNATVTATCTAIMHTITGAVNTAEYGSVSPASISVMDGSAISLSSNVLTCNGKTLTATPTESTTQYTYAFSNWSGVTNGATVSGNLTATATFTRTPKSYTLTWVTDGDALTGTYTSGSVAYGTPITQPGTPTKTGYTFAGWSSDVASTMPAANTTYTATWTAKEYDIVYKDQGNVTVTGEAMPETPSSHTYGTATSLKKRSKAGYVFGGWYTNSTCTEGPVTSIGATQVTASVTLYAKWTAMDLTALENNTLYTVQDMVPDGIEVSSTRLTYPGVSANNRFNLLGTGHENTTNGPVANIAGTKKIGGESFNTRIYFKKTAGVSGSTLPSHHAVQFKISAPGVLDIYCTKPVDIYLIKSGESAVQLDASESGDSKISKSVTAGTYYIYSNTTADDEKLYGLKFTPTYTVTLNTNGGTINAGNVTSYNYGTGATLPTDVTKSGYVFAGWYDNSGLTGDAVTTIADDATGNKAYWAKWTEVVEKCETLNTSWLSAYSTAKGEGTYGIINGVKYDVETLGDDGDGITMGYGEDHDTYFQLNIGDLGVIKEVKITIASIIAKPKSGNYGIMADFFEDDSFTHYDIEQHWDDEDSDNSIATESVSTGDLSLRPVSGDNNSFAFQTYTADLKISGICIYYEPTSYTLTWSTDGDVLTGDYTSGTVAYGTPITAPNTPTKTGYTFSAWSPTPAATMPAANTTYTATWTADSYTITLNKGDHGAANQSASVSYDATSLTSITHVTSTGYDRTGYYDGETKVLNADGSFAGDNITGYITSGKWSKTSDATLTAKWSAQSYTISYKDQGDETYSGSNLASLPTSHTYGAATDFVNGVKSGYRFMGWYTDASCTISAGSSIGATAITANTTYYAKWAPEYSVSITTTNASKSTGAATACGGENYVATFASVTGYDLPTSVTVTIGGSPAMLTTDYTWSAGTLTVLGASVTGAIAITVTGTAQTYTISYKDQGNETYSGSNLASLPTSHTYGAATALVDGVKAGYTFGGWYTDESCTVSAGSSIGATAKTANFTLYAKWTEDECGITLTQFGTQYKSGSNPRYLYAYTSNSFDEKFIIEADDGNTKGVTNSSTDSLYLLVKNGKFAKIHASAVLKDSTFEDVTKIKFDYRISASNKSKTLTLDVFVGATKVGSVSQDVTDQTWYTKTINVSPAKDGRVIIKNTAASSDQSVHLNNINICGTLPTPCTEITPTWSTDYSSTTLDVGGGNSSTPTVGTDGSSGAVSFSSSDTDIATVNSSTGVVTPKKSGSVTITATVAADDVNNYCEGSITKTFTIRAGVTYDGNSKTSGSVPTDDNKYAAGATVTTKTNSGSLERTGYVFNGWNTKSDGTGTHYEAGATFSMPTKSAGVKLYAEWVGYAESWDWWKSGQDNNSTTFTYLTSKNYSLSFASSASTSVASWDMSGDIQYRGVKIKTKDHSMSFWVQSGKRVSITFGYRSTKPTFTVGGVNKAGDLSTSTTDSATVTYVTTADTKFYIENETSTGTAFTIKSVKIVNACTSITPSLNHSSKTLYAFGGTPRQVALVVSGNTGSGDVTWTSSDDGVATVTSDGLVTAVAPGTATITASIAATGDYCEGETECTITVPALVTQTINVGNSDAAVAWGTPPNMTFNDPTSTLTKNAVIDVIGYTFNKETTYKGQRGGRYMTADIKAANGAMSDSKYLSLSFNSPNHNIRVGEVIFAIQPITNRLVAKASISDGTTTVTSAESDSIDAGVITDVKFTFTPTTLKAGTITVKIYVYGQPANKGFRLANTIYVNGGVLVDQRFTDANSTGLWSDPANWDGGSLPEIYHDVVIEKPVAVDIAHATAKSIVIYNNGSDKTGKLTIQPNKGLEVDGTIQKTTDGSTKTATGEADLVLESSSAGNASLIFNNSNSCQATVQMYSKAGIDGSTWNWQYVGTPFTGSIPLYNYYGSWMYKWDNGGWAVVKGGDELDPFAGYCLTQSEATTHVMGGTLVATDGNDQTINMAASTDMVLANSWTAPISIASFDIEGGDATFTSTPATIYLFNTGMAEERSEEGTEAGTYIAVPIYSAPYTGNGLIAPMQGFFVTTNNGAAGKITMNYNDLVRPSGEHTEIVAGPMKAPKRIEERPEVMKIRAEGSVYNDRVVILSREDFSQGFDNGWDGKKMSFGNASPSVYVINEEGGYDAVSAIPEYEGTVVGFRAGTDSEYTIRFEYDGEEMLYLNDLQEQEATPIDCMRTYTFTAEAGDNEARFIISTTPVQKVTTGVDPASGGQDAKVRKVIINDHIYIIRGGRMYSAEGALVK